MNYEFVIKLDLLLVYLYVMLTIMYKIVDIIAVIIVSQT
jgi:hypothetical protein